MPRTPRADQAGGLYHALNRGNLRATISLSYPGPNWVQRVNHALSDKEWEAARLSIQRGRPLRDDGWVESITRCLNLESTTRPRGRQRIRFSVTNDNRKA